MEAGKKMGTAEALGHIGAPWAARRNPGGEEGGDALGGGLRRLARLEEGGGKGRERGKGRCVRLNAAADEVLGEGNEGESEKKEFGYLLKRAFPPGSAGRRQTAQRRPGQMSSRMGFRVWPGKEAGRRPILSSSKAHPTTDRSCPSHETVQRNRQRSRSPMLASTHPFDFTD